VTTTAADGDADDAGAADVAGEAADAGWLADGGTGEDAPLAADGEPAGDGEAVAAERACEPADRASGRDGDAVAAAELITGTSTRLATMTSSRRIETPPYQRRRPPAAFSATRTTMKTTDHPKPTGRDT
jgi:hypothetical protein